MKNLPEHKKEAKETPLHSAMDNAPAERPLEGAQHHPLHKEGHDYSHVESFVDGLENHEAEHAMHHAKKKLGLGDSDTNGLEEPTMDDFEEAKKQS